MDAVRTLRAEIMKAVRGRYQDYDKEMPQRVMDAVAAFKKARKGESQTREEPTQTGFDREETGGEDRSE